MIESTTEIPSLEGTSPRETASTSAHRVPNTLIADYGKRKRKAIDPIIRSFPNTNGVIVSRGLPRRHGFDTMLVRVEFVIDKVALLQASL